MRTLLFAISILFAPLAPASAEEPQTQEELTARAEAGDADAMMDLSILLLDQQDATDARDWARRAAEAGHVEAMNMYAVILRNSDVAADRAESERWEERAFSAGSQGARINRGLRMIYEHGSEASWTQGLAFISTLENAQAGDTITNIALDYAGTQHSTPARVRELLRIAAERGSPEGQWHYAMMLRQGQGGPTDVVEAFDWTRRSGEAGYLDGIISSAVMLATGEGVAENDAEARELYARATEQSSAHALRGLAYMLLTGEGGPIDEVRGWTFMLLAAEGRDQAAINALNQYGRHLPAETMRAASAIRTEWLTTHDPPR